MSEEQEAARLAEEQAWAAGEAERIALEQRLSIDEAELLEARQDAQLLNLINMAPADIAAAIDSAFADPAQRVILKRICRVLIPTARKVFR